MNTQEQTEFTRACGTKTLNKIKNTPGSKVRWALSKSHIGTDICNEHATGGKNHDGIYEADECPPYPAHDGCKCCLVPEIEDLSCLMKRLGEWKKHPYSQPDIEEWFQKNKDKFDN